MLDKILGMDKGTRERTIASVVTAIVNFLAVFNIIQFSNEQVDAMVKLAIIIVTGIVWGYGFYKNECHTEKNCKYTGIMRAEGVSPVQQGCNEVMKDD